MKFIKKFLYVICSITACSYLGANFAISQQNDESIIQLRNQPKFESLTHSDIRNKSVLQNRKLLERSRGFLFWRDAEINSFGIWVEAEGPTQPLNDPAELDKLLKIISEYPISDLYVQVYRNGKSWFASEYADDSPYKKIVGKGRDPIAEIIDAAKKKNQFVKVHAWFNALRLGEDQKAKVFESLGTDVTLVSSRGESLFATRGLGVVGCRPDTPGIWLDPQNKKVSLLIIKVLSEMMSKYPEIDGLHLDMIRSPFPYSATETISADCTDFHSPLGKSLENLTQEERSEQAGTTQLIKQVRKVIDTMYPNLTLTTAVLSNQKKALQNANQPWPHWVEKDYVDYVVTMNYSEKMERFEREVLEAKEYGVDKVSIGVGAWLAQNNSQLLEKQVAFVKEHMMKGVVLFSHGNLALDKADTLYKITSSVVEKK